MGAAATAQEQPEALVWEDAGLAVWEGPRGARQSPHWGQQSAAGGGHSEVYTCVMFLQLYYMYVHVHVYSFYMYMYMYVCYTSRGHLLSVLCQWWRIAMFDEQNCREMLHSEFLVTEAHMYVYCIRCTMYNMYMYMYYILYICKYYLFYFFLAW